MEASTPIWQLTVGEFIELIDKSVTSSMKGRGNDINDKDEHPCGRKYVYGLKGLAELLGVSVSKSYNIKRSGVIDAAISQNGRSIITDADMAVRLFGESNRKHKHK